MVVPFWKQNMIQNIENMSRNTPMKISFKEKFFFDQCDTKTTFSLFKITTKMSLDLIWRLFVVFDFAWKKITPYFTRTFLREGPCKNMMKLSQE